MKLPFGIASFREYFASYGGEVRKLSGKSKLRQSVEIIIAGFKGFSIKDYYHLPLFMGEGYDKLGSLQYDRLNPYLNRRYTGVVPFNKWMAENFLTGAGLPCVRSLGFYHRDFGILRDGGALRTLADVRALYKKVEHDLVFKPADQGRGEGVSITGDYDGETDTISVNNQYHVPLAEFVASLNKQQCLWVVQPRIMQHAEIAKLHPSSLNTIRMVTLIDDDHTIAPQFAILRMGGGGSVVDNTSAGGIYAMVDLATGVAGKTQEARPWLHEDKHPTTGAQVSGFKVPFWEEAKALAVAAHSAMPYPHDLGWDIAITDNGPIIVELNAYWRPDVSQRDHVNLMNMALGRIYKKRFGK